jgi:hypothetical protein
MTGVQSELNLAILHTSNIKKFIYLGKNLGSQLQAENAACRPGIYCPIVMSHGRTSPLPLLVPVNARLMITRVSVNEKLECSLFMPLRFPCS